MYSMSKQQSYWPSMVEMLRYFSDNNMGLDDKSVPNVAQNSSKLNTNAALPRLVCTNNDDYSSTHYCIT